MHDSGEDDKDSLLLGWERARIGTAEAAKRL